MVLLRDKHGKMEDAMLRRHQMMLAMCALISLGAGCAADDVGCMTSALSMASYQDKLDFVGRWEHVATVAEIDGELPLAIGTETPPREITWEFTEDLLLTGDEPQLAFHIDRHVTLGTLGDGRQCVAMDTLDWSERGHFRVDLSVELGAMGSVPGEVEEWLIEPVSYFIEPGGPERFRIPQRDLDGRTLSLVLPLKYIVRACDECEAVVVTVMHRFERID
ncbi:MAG: hypothetical protein ACI9KE_003766 [Polyangiales bacterium]|jgi:hypothetical protein